MSKIFILLFLMMFIIMPVLANDKSEVENIITEYAKAMSGSDLDAVMSLYTVNCVFLPNDLPTAKGWKAVKNAYRHELKVIDLDVETIIDEIIMGGNTAYARTRSNGFVTVLSSMKKKPTNNYRAFFVFKKEREQWKISQFMFNFNR